MGIAIIDPVSPKLEAMAAEWGRPLLQEWGKATIHWIRETFREGGRPKWKPLAASTLAGRRQGDGSFSPQPLQRSGALFRSFEMMELTSHQVTVGTADRKAIFHELGTRGPYEIRPKNAKALALPGLGAGGQFSLSKLNKPTGSTAYTVQAGKRVRGRTGGQAAVPYKSVRFFQRVMHPGLTPRPMLPTPEQLVPILERTTNAFMTALKRRLGLA